MKKWPKEPCRICGYDKFSLWGKRQGHNLFQCKNCQVVFFYPYPTPEALKTYYNANYHVDRGYDGSGEAGELRRRMYALDVADLEATLPRGGRFLDVGCAEGVFLSMLGPRWEKFGIDISTRAVSEAQKKEDVTARVADVTDMDAESFDVVHLRGVFEHLLQPRRFMTDVRRVLGKNGWLVLSNTPNAAGAVPRLFRGRFKLIIPNEHLHYFTPRTVRVLAAETGYKVGRIAYPYFGSPYCNFWKDLLSIPVNLLAKVQSPPFYGNIFTAYLRVNEQ